MFIEPGTIIRGDESSRGDPHSVIFSCIPYFDIRKPLKGTVGQGDRLHPPRTLIQSYYPYEPVRDRDKEQAYQKFGNGGDGGLIHVPSLWMLNIDSKTVVTCGYRPLSSEFVKSIEVLQEDLKQLGTSTRTETPLTNIRLSDGDGRVLLYSLDECQTYFEMEQKLRELKCYSRHAEFEPTTQMSWLSPDGEKKVTPANWQTIIQRRDLLFIDLSVNDENKATGTNDDVPGLQSLQTQIHSPKNLVGKLLFICQILAPGYESHVLVVDKASGLLMCLAASRYRHSSTGHLLSKTTRPHQDSSRRRSNERFDAWSSLKRRC